MSSSAKSAIQLGTRLIKPSSQLGKTALVSGSATGLGKNAAIMMARQGSRVIVSDIARREQECLRVVEEIKGFGGQAVYVPLDVTKEKDWQQAISKSEKAFDSPLDILINNAGVLSLHNEDGSVADSAVFENVTLQQYRSLMNVNLDGVFLGTKYALLSMKKNKSPESKSIINLSSIAGIVGFAAFPVYCASKGGVRNFTKAVALYCQQNPELKTIRVNSIHPGFIKTEMTVDYDEFAAKNTPMGRMGVVSEIGNACVFLASEESSYMTGSELVIDGGYVAQ